MAVPHDAVAALVLLKDVANAQFRLWRVFRGCTDALARDDDRSSSGGCAGIHSLHAPAHTLPVLAPRLKSDQFFFTFPKPVALNLRPSQLLSLSAFSIA